MSTVTRARHRWVEAVAAAVVLWPLSLEGSDLPPWRDAVDLPLPDSTGSVVVQRGEQSILDAPSASAKRRGTARMGAGLPWFGAKRGSGCAARWISVGPLAWICQDVLAFDPRPPIEAGQASEGTAAGGLPFRYFFVRQGGTSGYLRLEDAEDVAPDHEFEPGFAVAGVEEGARQSARTCSAPRILDPAARSRTGDALRLSRRRSPGGKIDFAWVVEDRAVVYAAAGAASPIRALHAVGSRK
jgi:hypothetical protein